MASITRVSPPKSVGEIPSDSYLWEVSLSGIVTPKWVELFKRAGAGTANAKPTGVTFEPVAALSFVSPQAFVEEWMTSIDTWIDVTNTTLSKETDDADTRTRDHERTKEEALHRRLRAVSDEVKNL
jgi:hypothetical protein